MRYCSILIGILLALLVHIEPVLAQVNQLDTIVNFVLVGTPLSSTIPVGTFSCPASVGSGVGACWLAALFVYAVGQGRLLIGTLAFITITIAGFNLIIRQSEESMTTARRTVLGVVLGLFLVFTSEQFVDALYGGFTINPGDVLVDPSNIDAGTLILSEELLGIVRWGETIVAIVAIGLLVGEGIMVLASFGSEQALQKANRAVLYTILGILLIVFDRTIASIFGYTDIGTLPGAPDASIFIVEIFGFVRLVLGFVAIVAVAIIIYAGFLMMGSFGNDELITKARTMLINAVIGFVLITLSFVIVHFVIIGASATTVP
ncbi:MAG TPA: hypothetical protein VJB82_05525 [Candidatus Peribacterales bacterium]|nr:hypothetical protein [Candidatus Peribacterales bacterium]